MSTGHLIRLYTCNSRFLRTCSSHHLCCISHASATFFILRSNPFFLPLDESSQCMPTLPRASKFSLVFDLAPVLLLSHPRRQTNAERIRPCFRPLTCNYCRIEMFIPEHRFNERLSLSPVCLLTLIKRPSVFTGDITQKGYEKKRTKLLAPYIIHTPGTNLLV